MAGKCRSSAKLLSPGGQVASAMVTCARLGLRAKYIGTLGDDQRGVIQLESLRASGINLDDIEIRTNCPNQSAYILVDQATGERTVLWHRDDCLRLDPARSNARERSLAHACCISMGTTRPLSPARPKSRAGIKSLSLSMWIPSILASTACCPNVDYLVASSEFPSRWTREPDPFRALAMIQDEYGMRVAAMTLGADGALARVDGRVRLFARVRGRTASTPPAPATCFMARSVMLCSRTCPCAKRSSFPMPWQP